MRWKKLGKIFEWERKTIWGISHSANPLCLEIKNGILEIAFSVRDKYGKSNVGSFKYSLEQDKILEVRNNPLMLHGKEKEIDESGIGIGKVIKINKKKYIYYMAWQTPHNEHWRGDIARGVYNEEKKEFERDDSFIFGVDTEYDKVSLSYPEILKVEEKYYMWYGSTISWEYGNGEMLHVINYATSDDGITFERKGIAIKPEIGIKQAFSRPTVIYWNGLWRMWFSYRGNNDKYKIGYAESENLKEWETKDSNFYVSENGWDSEMVCYPYVFEYQNKLYMLYNGNGYGKTGIGLAVLEKDESDER